MKISIITIAYNSGKTICDTFDSVLAQNYKDYEYIVIDGASTDNTVDIIKQYEPRFCGRMKWISEPDKGLYDATNKGIHMASGDVIGFLNSDDFYTSHDILSSIAESMKDDNIDAVFGDVHFVKPYNTEKCVRYYSSKRFNPRYFRVGFMPAHPSFYVRKWCHEKYGDYSLDYKISADFDLMVRLFYKYKIRYKYLAIDFVTMRTGGASTKNWQSRLRLNKEDIYACKKYGIRTNWVLMLSRYLYKIKEFLPTKEKKQSPYIYTMPPLPQTFVIGEKALQR